MAKFSDIPKFVHSYYSVDISLDFLLSTLEKYKEEDKLNMNPDFQRAHIWTEEQQIAYVEFILKKPQSGLDIYFNHPGWMYSFEGDFVLVDGKQRLEALKRFLSNEIKVYGFFYKEFEDKRYLASIYLKFHIARLQTKKEILKWYLDFNSGGTPHTKEELNKVRRLLKKEKEV